MSEIEEVVRILENWFGKPLKYNIDEQRVRRCLLDPIVKVISIARSQAADAENNRCLEIVEAARCGEIDQDWRAVIAYLECPLPLADYIRALPTEKHEHE